MRNKTLFCYYDQLQQPFINRIMIKQDYIVRMIQKIISMIAQALLNKQKISRPTWQEYDSITLQILEVSSERLTDMTPEEIIDYYQTGNDPIEKIELAAMTLLKIADEIEDEQFLLKSKLFQNGLHLLKHVQQKNQAFSIQRMNLIQLLDSHQ